MGMMVVDLVEVGRFLTDVGVAVSGDVTWKCRRVGRVSGCPMVRIQYFDTM
jgi:hypothetical protein